MSTAKDLRGWRGTGQFVLDLLGSGLGGDMHDLYVVPIQGHEVWHKHIAVIIVTLQSKSPYCCYRQLHNNQTIKHFNKSYNDDNNKRTTKYILGVPQKAGRSIFITLTFKNIAYFDFIRYNIVFWKEWYQHNWNWMSFDFMFISQNIIIIIFSPFSWHFSQG